LFKNKTILITGGTGSLGQALTKKILKLNPKAIRIFSRDESKQETMSDRFEDDRLRFLIGDIRDKERLRRAIENVDIVIHTAALKRVPAAEYNPFEFIKTNIDGSQNVIDVSMDEKVDICLGVSSDKAVSPLNLYGATKLSMEKLFVAANYYKGKKNTIFTCVRYGNVLGSNGSVVPKFVNQIQNKKLITVTDDNMTRFNITMDDAIELIFTALKFGKGSEIFIPKLKSYKLKDMIKAFQEISKIKFKVQKIPVRMGEKYDELLLNEYEIPYAVETKDLYILFPPRPEDFLKLKKLYPTSKLLKLTSYSSGNAELLSVTELKNILIKNKFAP
jgi:UDP-N-acetylglucosamine 4,6-dehydratase/5-epimerase